MWGLPARDLDHSPRHGATMAQLTVTAVRAGCARQKIHYFVALISVGRNKNEGHLRKSD